MITRSAAPSLDQSLGRGHDVQVAVSVSIGALIEKFYGELWNQWNDAAVEGTLSPRFTFRGSLGRRHPGGRGGGGTGTWCAEALLIFTMTSWIWSVMTGGRRHGFVSPAHIPGRCWGCPQRSGGSNTRGQPFSP
jgi:hypothetical protein